MPPSTLWAVEARDIRGLLRQVERNPAQLELLAGLLDEFADPLIPSGIKEQYPDWKPRELIQLPDFMLAALFPDAMVAGASETRDASGSSLFLACRFPRLGRWLFAADSPDGWLTFGQSPQPMTGAAHVFGGAGILPCDPARGPFVQLAWRSAAGPETAGQGFLPETPAAGPPGLFNPFESDSGVAGTPEGDGASPSSPGGAEDYLARLTIRPAADGWEARGNLLARPDREAAAPPAGPAAIPLPAWGGDVAVRVKASPERLETWREAVRGRSPASVEALLLDAWLAKAAGDFYLAARPPAAPEVASVPPFPVFSLGWRWLPGTGVQAANDFEAALAAAFASLTGPDAPYPLPLIRNRLSYASRVEDGAIRGRLTLPAVAVNSIQPAWRLPLAEGTVNWIATDPAGLPRLEPDPAGEGGDFLAVSWNLSPAFREGLLAVMRDRLETLPDRRFAWRRSLLEHFALAGPLLQAIAGGSLRIKDMGEGQADISLLVGSRPDGKGR